METRNTLQFIGERMRAANVERVLFQYNKKTGVLLCSHPNAAFLEKVILDSPSWQHQGGHEAIIIQRAQSANCLFIICVHSTVRGRPEGGVRLDTYDSFEKALGVCMDLAYGMTRKNGMGRIWEGGAKSIIVPFDEETLRIIHPENAVELAHARTSSDSVRSKILSEFGRVVASLHGLYLVGEDLRLDGSDMITILRNNVHTSCLPVEVGGAGNPSPYTAAGVFEAIKAAVDFEFPENPELLDKTVLVKGAGNVGSALVKMLLEAGVHVVVHDPWNPAIEKLKQACAPILTGTLTCIQSESEFESHPGDVFSPNASSKSIRQMTVDRLKCRIICGAENAQLEDWDLLQEMKNRGIVYVPETTLNFMGVFSAYQEHLGIIWDEFRTKTEAIGAEVREILAEAHERGLSAYYVAEERALERAREPHPLFPGRGVAQIQQLMLEWSEEHDKVNAN